MRQAFCFTVQRKYGWETIDARFGALDRWRKDAKK
jgi:hypothetical protein